MASSTHSHPTGAVVVFSGGQDSTTCLLQAIAERGPEQVACITFAYGQRHSLEVSVAGRIANLLGVRNHRIVKTDWFNAVTTNALLDPQTPISREGDSLPNTFVAGRNAFFLLAAAVYARTLGWRDIVTGVCETDYSGYPDCRAAFVESMNQSINLAMDGNFRILTPLMHLNKAQTWALADRLGKLDFVRRETLTCYEGIPGDGCGKCPACLLRAKGLKEYEQTYR
ncbi:MAG: 7-cyano-7-deazaguanine synthase QueC [Kiritimatiellia bacterium]|nr:7-cyano-7-deazaguanine synthase QueC [Kiritimatiellia bacterium]